MPCHSIPYHTMLHCDSVCVLFINSVFINDIYCVLFVVYSSIGHFTVAVYSSFYRNITVGKKPSPCTPGPAPNDFLSRFLSTSQTRGHSGSFYWAPRRVTTASCWPSRPYVQVNKRRCSRTAFWMEWNGTEDNKHPLFYSRRVRDFHSLLILIVGHRVGLQFNALL